MRFTDTKRRRPWLLIILGMGLIVLLMLGVCDFQPSPKTVRKTVVFEAD